MGFGFLGEGRLGQGLLGSGLLLALIELKGRMGPVLLLFELGDELLVLSLLKRNEI